MDLSLLGGQCWRLYNENRKVHGSFHKEALRSCYNQDIERSKTMLAEYIQNAIAIAEYKKLEDGSWFAEIPGFEGGWANGSSVEDPFTRRPI